MELRQAVALLEPMVAGAVKPARPSHERDQILHFYETLTGMLANLNMATSESQQRKGLQRVYLWYSSSKHQLPTTLLRRFAQLPKHERETVNAARRASLVGSSPVSSSGSFAVGYLATATSNNSTARTANAAAPDDDGGGGDNDELRDILGEPLEDSTLVTVRGTELSGPPEFLEGVEVETVSTIHSAADFQRVFGSRKARHSSTKRRRRQRLIKRPRCRESRPGNPQERGCASKHYSDHHVVAG